MMDHQQLAEGMAWFLAINRRDADGSIKIHLENTRLLVKELRLALDATDLDVWAVEEFDKNARQPDKSP